MDMQAFDLVRQMGAGHYLTRSLHAVAELGVADAVGETPVAVDDLARQVGANADALGRVLRLLASRGIFRLDDNGVSHTAASAFLAESHPASLRALVRMFAQPIQWQCAGDLLHAIRTGEAVAPLAYPDGGLWGYFRDNPEHGRVFDAAMVSKATAQIAGILASHDFSRYRRVVDVGGGGGHMLRGIVGKHPEVAGVLFDLPPVVDAARGSGSDGGIAYVPGDFFADEVPGGDAIILMEVIHDWDDAASHRILKTVRRAAEPHTRLLLIETEVPEDDSPDWSKLLDIVMLGVFAARQRTAAEYGALLQSNGFELIGRTDTGAGISIFEARPA